MFNRIAIAAGFVAAALMPSVAGAQTTTVRVEQPTTPNFAVQAGGGSNTFVTELDTATDPGWSWDVRGVFGLRWPVGLEAAYVGSTNKFKDIGDAYLFRNGGEALLRANLMAITGLDSHFLSPQVDIQPYLSGGVGMSDQRITDSSGSEISSSTGVTFKKAQTTTNIPAALGVDALISRNIDVGLRASYKYDFANGYRTDVAKADVQSWQAMARAGVAF